MTSSVHRVKEELGHLKPSRHCCQVAELSALLHMDGSYTIRGSGGHLLVTESSGVYTARKIYELVHTLFTLQTPVIKVIRSTPRRGNVYRLEIADQPGFHQALNDTLSRTILTSGCTMLVVIALFAAFVLPIPAVSGVLALNTVRDLAGSSESARQFDIAVDYGTKFLPAVTVPVEVGTGIFPNQYLTKVTSSIIGVETGQPENAGPTFDVCSAVRTVAGTHSAVVITTLDPSVLRPYMEADGCADVPVVRIDGPPRTLQGVPTARSSASDRS